MMDISKRLELTEEEAFALLALSMTSAGKFDATSERALKKLADYCRNHISHNQSSLAVCELKEAGA